MFLMVYVVSITQVVGNSMSPTLENGEVLILNKAKYRLSEVKRGDIIAFTYEDTKYLIKRVIGLPGDYVSIKDNKVYEIVKNLSGGEKVKVALAKLLVSNSNFLILDEPTNFLDIESIEGLELLIKQYAGTVLLISHDKRFVDNVCDNIIIFKDKKLVQYDGNYSDYLKYEENKDKNKVLSNDRLVLEFRLTKLDSEIALENDANKKLLLEKEREEILSKLKNS